MPKSITKPDCQFERGPRYWEAACLVLTDSSASFGLTQAVLSKSFHWVNERVKVLTVAICLPHRRIGHDIWSEIAERLSDTHIDSPSMLVPELVVRSSISIFRNWGTVLRHGVLSQLEEAFLDPDKRLRHFAPVPSWMQLNETGGLERYRRMLRESLEIADVKNALEALEDKLHNISTFPQLTGALI